MPEATPDPTAARNLEGTLKEFDTPFGDEDFVSDIFEGGAGTPEPPAGEPVEEPAEEPAEAQPEPEIDIFEEGASAEEEEAPEQEEQEEEEVPESLSEKGKADWKAAASAKKELKTQLDVEKKARETLSAEVEELRRQTAEIAELRQQKEDFEEAQKELAISRVEGRKDYKEQVTAPLKAIEENAYLIAKSAEVSAEKVFDAIAEPDPAKRRTLLKEVTEDMDSVDRDEIFQMARDTQMLLAKRDEIRGHAVEAGKEAKEKADVAEAAAARKAKETYDSASEHVISELRKRIPFEALADGETEEGVYKAALDKVKSSDFDGATVDRKALYVATTILMPRLTKQLVAAKKTIDKLEGRVNKKRASTPRIGGDAPDPPTEGHDGDVEAAVADFFGQSRDVPILERLKNF